MAMPKATAIISTYNQSNQIQRSDVSLCDGWYSSTTLMIVRVTCLVLPIESTSGRTLTYHQLLKAVRRCSRGLARLGFEKGDILCMFTPNILEYPIVFYAVASLGGTFQATNPLYNARELQHTLDICKSKFLVTVPALLPTVRHAQSKPKIIVIGGVENGTNFSSLVAEDISTEPVIDADIDAKNDVAGIVFSSGTTGKPKAVQHTHYSLVALTLQLMTTGNMKSSDNCVAFLPFFHVYGLGVVLNTNLYCGGQCVIMSRFEPKEFLKNVTKYKLTSLYLVPPVMVLLSKLPITRQYDLSSVKRIVCGAAPLSMDVEAKIKELFKIPFVTQGYGLTESPCTHIMPVNQHKFGSVGKLMRGGECKSVDTETLKTVPVNVDGEVYIRTPVVMKGYLSNPESTAAMLDTEGWLRTGDIGHVDSEGFLFIVDRIKELIKYKGFQVAPAELEDILLSHPEVADVGVIGVPDVDAGELPKAFVVRKPGSLVTALALQDYVKTKVSGTKWLRGGVTFLSGIPKSASGKILRRLLRDMEKNNQSKL